jgi:hypothetical protein
MRRCVNLSWMARTLAVPLLLSVLVHGLLVAVLWVWPGQQPPRPALSIASTRVTVDSHAPAPLMANLSPDPIMPVDLAPQPGQVPIVHPETPISAKPAHATDRSAGQSPVAYAPGSPATGDAPRDGHDGSGGGGLFPVPATAGCVVYVLDSSVSMAEDGKWDFARHEAIASLRGLHASVRFQVIVYSDYAQPLRIDGNSGLLPAEPAMVARVADLLNNLEAGGGSNHLAGLQCGLAFHPDVLYFLTDADELHRADVKHVTTHWNRGSVIHTIELTYRRSVHPDGPLAQLAHDNGGTYHRIFPLNN